MTHCVPFSAVTMQWSAVEAKGDIPEPLSGHSATLFGSQIFVFGGYDGQTYHDQLYVFDTRALTLLSAQWNWDRSSTADPFPFAETLEWRKQNPSGDIPPARAWHTANQVRTKIFIFGGTGASAYNDLHILDPGVMRYTTDRPSPFYWLFLHVCVGSTSSRWLASPAPAVATPRLSSATSSSTWLAGCSIRGWTISTFSTLRTFPGRPSRCASPTCVFALANISG